MRFRTLFTLLLSLIVPAGSASADMRFNFENCDNIKKVFILVQNSLKIKGSFGLQLLYEYDMITLKTVCVSTDQTGSV